MNPFDVTVFHAINGLAAQHYTWLNDIMYFFAKYSLELYVVLFIIGWFALPKPDIRGRHALVMSGCAGILALIINVIIAHLWFRPRPFTVLQPGTFTQLLPHSPDASFPSDHASGSWAFAAGSWGRVHKWVQISFTVLAVLVMFSRVYVGVHWPTDVIASFFIGLFSGRIIWLLSRYIYPITSTVAGWFRFGKSSGGHHMNM